ncbi:PaaI family thioesterase [Rhodococcus koreensis]
MPRSGSFWDGVEGRTPMPPAARTLRFELIDAHPAAGTITAQFQGTTAFTNPFGHVLAAMLYDTVGPALLAALPAGWFIETLDLHCFFAAPARPGPLSVGVEWSPVTATSPPSTAR